MELKHTYGFSKQSHTIRQIYANRYKQLKRDLLAGSLTGPLKVIDDAVRDRLTQYGGKEERTSIAATASNEQERELEEELEEQRERERPARVDPCEPIMHKELIKLCETHGNMVNLPKLPEVFHSIEYAFTGTTFHLDCQPSSWPKNFWVSTEFQRVVEAQGQLLNPFMRPPRWIVVYRNEHIIFVSAFEANQLIKCLESNNSSITTLRLLLPRIKRDQSICVNDLALTIPPSIAISTGTSPYVIVMEKLVQLFIFNATLNFGSVEEQTAYCHCLGLYPKPWTEEGKKTVADHSIISDGGFIEQMEHRKLLGICRPQFISDPLKFVKQLIQSRNNAYAPITSHVGSIIYDSVKLL
ncbi:unnamed protein product [Rotaria socialis]|nr:unnamed protein product [Rotaria socialis]